MSKNIKLLETEYDECNINGICSISPTLAAIKSAILEFLTEHAFYIREIHSFNAKNNEIKNDFIETFSILITNSEYNEETLHKIISETIESITRTKNTYKNLCEEKNIPPKFFKSQIKLKSDFQFLDIIKKGQKFSNKFKQNLSEEQIKGFDMIINIIKSIVIYIIELQHFGVDFDKYYVEILDALSIQRLKKLTKKQIIEYMQKYSKVDYELLNLIFELRKKEFGNFTEKEVITSEQKGKAILVAGANLKELELILEATKDKNINIYTHGQMITGHIFEKFKEYPHLIGHWGKGAEYYLSDFSSFPGPIFLTKLSLFRVENLYFNKFFTTAKFVSKNTTPVVDNNFEPLIKSALRSEGFEETKSVEKIKVGFIEENYNKEIDNIIEKIKSKKIKYFFGIGVSNKTKVQTDYFKRFFELLTDDCFALSFYYKNKKHQNILLINLDYAFPVLYQVLDRLLPLKKDYDLSLNVLMTRCEPHTIPNLIKLKSMGLDNIYFHQCSPNLINPALMDLMLEWIGISRYTAADIDMNSIKSGK
jgi:hydroxylamine reductase